MKSYGVSEVFFSVQGEGAYTGTPMAFLRLAGCNLWDGIEEHRPRGTGSCADWCDASFLPKLGRMSEEEIAKHLRFVAPGCHHACVTGGEPTLQWDAGLAGAIAAAGFDEISMETNGTTIGAPPGVTWLTLSPKRIALHDYALDDVKRAVDEFCASAGWHVAIKERSQWGFVVLEP